MSEKRFIYHEKHFPLNVREIVDNENGETYNCEDATDVLNELFDENKQLKEENEKFIQKKCLPCELVNLQTREIDKLKKENEQLKEKNERLQWELDNLNYFANLKVSAMRGSDCGHDRCYVTSMQKKGDGV